MYFLQFQVERFFHDWLAKKFWNLDILALHIFFSNSKVQDDTNDIDFKYLKFQTSDKSWKLKILSIWGCLIEAVCLKFKV